MNLSFCSGYRAPISKLTPSDKTKVAERNKICQDLANRDLIGYSREVSRFKIEPAGKALLKHEAANLPLTDQHLAILKACEAKSIVPSDLKKLVSAERQPLIQELAAKGLIEEQKVQIKEVWLTDRGNAYLRDECNPSGTATISLTLLSSYLQFLRQSIRGSEKGVQTPLSSTTLTHKPEDPEILQLIQDLDRELGTDNYLPIFHLRQKLQPPLSRDEFDQAIYRLWRADKIEVSTLVEVIHYTPEQIQAGIPQETGGPLFFLIIPNK
jgi:trehalose-6-phosphate synthase